MLLDRTDYGLRNLLVIGVGQVETVHDESIALDIENQRAGREGDGVRERKPAYGRTQRGPRTHDAGPDFSP